MLEVALVVSPMVVLGLGALWAKARASRLEVVNLCAIAPAEKRRKRTRPIDAVVLHQMGFSRGSDVQRYSRVTAHFVVMPDGSVAQLHPTSAKLSSSHGFNDRSVAIEFAGNLRSANGNWWRPETYGRDRLTAEQVDAGRRLVRQLHRAGVKYVLAHRQSSADRGNDPGPEIWSSIGQWAIDRLGMSDGGPSYAIGSGKPIPDAWRRFNLNA